MRSTIRTLAAVSLTIGLLGASCASDGGPTSQSVTPDTEPPTSISADDNTADDNTADDNVPDAALGEVSATYSDPANWLCRPELSDDACAVDLDATLVHADGTTEVQAFEPAVDAPVDCFYVYPTVSGDPGENSDLVPDDGELGVVATQAARFAQVCDVYAPMYRQIPLRALMGRLSSSSPQSSSPERSSQEGSEKPDGPLDGSPGQIAYDDVREAFMHYLAGSDPDRRFVLIGHSQGAAQLTRLVGEEIDRDDTLRSRMLSAMLIGGSVPDSGPGAYRNIGACTDPTDTGCVISYASFYSGEPPPADSLFARIHGDSSARAICTNPGDPTNPGPVPLQTYMPTDPTTSPPGIQTPYVHYDGLVTGECVADGDSDWLEVTNTSSGEPGWPTDLGGRITPQWGSHLLDINFAIGDLIELVASQSAAG